jgi:hypothetical protein
LMAAGASTCAGCAADKCSAMAPATCGTAMEVPEDQVYASSLTAGHRSACVSGRPCETGMRQEVAHQQEWLEQAKERAGRTSISCRQLMPLNLLAPPHADQISTPGANSDTQAPVLLLQQTAIIATKVWERAQCISCHSVL